MPAAPGTPPSLGRDDAPAIALAQATVAVHPWASSTGRPRAHRTLNAPLHLSTQWEGAGLQELAGLFDNDPDREDGRRDDDVSRHGEQGRASCAASAARRRSTMRAIAV